MNKGLTRIVIAAVAVLAIGGIAIASTGGSSDNASQNMDDMATSSSNAQNNTNNMPGASATDSNTVKIEIKGYKYTPEMLKVKVGTTVTWTNQDNVQHNVMVVGNEGPKSELLAKGESYSYTFDKVGTFNYFCEPHPYMKASVIVE